MINSSELVANALRMAHHHSFNNRSEVENSGICVCFSCQRANFASSIHTWVDDGSTAICSWCGADTIIGDASGLPLTRPFIKALHQFWLDNSLDSLFEDLELDETKDA